MSDIVALLLYPCVAAVIFVGMHTWLGLQVLRRHVVFADLALAQLAALGSLLAVAAGHAPNGFASFAYALLATTLGALLLTSLRRRSAQVSQEAIIGIVYVAATALTILVVDRLPQGAEHVKRMLVGNILAVGPAEAAQLAFVYAAIGGMHALCRRQLLAAVAGEGRRTLLWDFVFYATFGVVVTSSVAKAGVLLVFSFLIIPAVIGTLFSERIGIALLIGWGAGTVASLAGFGASVALDLPTGAAMVACFAATLLLMAGVRTLARSSAGLWRTGFVVAAALSLAVLAQAAWLVAVPAADQPLLAVLERMAPSGPVWFMTNSERSAFLDASATELRLRDEVDRLRAAERDSRWQGAGLDEEALRRIASYQQTFNEMGRGERFVQDHLRIVARRRERWYVGLPALFAAASVLLLLVRSQRQWCGLPCLRRTGLVPTLIPGDVVVMDNLPADRIPPCRRQSCMRHRHR